MGQDHIRQIGRSLGFLVFALFIALVSAFGLGIVVWIVWNYMIATSPLLPHLAYMQCSGIVLLFDLLMTPSAILGMRLMHEATTTSMQPEEKPPLLEGSSTPPSQ